MAGVIDTNLLLYGVNRDSEEHTAARTFLSEAGASPEHWYLTEGIIYEFLRVATHARVFPEPLRWREAIRFLSPFLTHPSFHILQAGERHWRVLEQVLGELQHPAGNLFFDARTAALMREHGIRRIYTTDADFLRFSGIEVVNPLSSN